MFVFLYMYVYVYICKLVNTVLYVVYAILHAFGK